MYTFMYLYLYVRIHTFLYTQRYVCCVALGGGQHAPPVILYLLEAPKWEENLLWYEKARIWRVCGLIAFLPFYTLELIAVMMKLN